MLGSLDREPEQDSRRLFLNVNTGRFVWKDMPMLSRYVCLAADDTNGLLVLRPESDFTIYILNPFTGHMVSHPPSWAIFAISALKVQVDGPQRNLLYTWNNSCHAVRNSKAFLTDSTALSSSKAMVSFQGCSYEVDDKGKVRVVKEQHRQVREPVLYPTEEWPVLMDLHIDRAPLLTFLVDSAGEVLLVRLRTSDRHGAAQIFRVDLHDETLHAVTSIGQRAILLGNRWCLSVDARNLPGIESNCIYYIGGEWSKTRRICVYRIQDKSHGKIFKSWPYEMLRSPALPLSLLEVLMDYPMQVESRVGSAPPTWKY
ncbi:hypothetical protein ACQ4PT_061684 [Festuca glaucescens]